LTVEALAQAKKLPASFLLRLGLYNLPNDQGVGIPYYAQNGALIAVRRRSSVAAKDPVWAIGWPRKILAAAYGQSKIAEAAKAGFLFIAEGESDCWILWHYGLPALGLPGGVKTLSAEHLAGVRKVYFGPAPGPANPDFQACLELRLAQLNFTGQLLALNMPMGIKNPSDLHLASAEKFMDGMQLAMANVWPQSLPQENSEVLMADEAKEAKDGGNSAKRDGTAGHANAGRVDTDPTAEERTRCTVRLSDVPEVKVQWLWPGRIPLGKLTILDGDPGLGKSTATLDLAARLTRGQAMPVTPEPCLPPSNIVLLTAEDGLGDTIRPRLVAAGAELSRIIAFQGLKSPRGSIFPIYLPHNVRDLAEVVMESQAKLVLIDPLMAYLPESINAHNDQSVRQALLPLANLAETTGASVTVIRHLNKQAGKSAIYRGSGSIGIIGAARSGLLVCKDPDRPKGRFLGVTKSKLCQQAKTVTFELLDKNGVPVVQWQDEIDYEIEKALACAAAEGDDSRSEADEFLLSCLANGPRPVAQIFREGQALHLTEKVLRRARKRLKITTRLIPAPSGKGGHWVWELPQDE
jgi:hypothetical protein